jgi:hypothetical protein
MTAAGSSPRRQGGAMATPDETSPEILRVAPGRRGLRAAGAGLTLGLALLAGPAMAQTTPAEKPAEETKAPNTGRVSLSAGVDWTSAYFFRGIKQETEDLILQPYGEITFKLVENAGALTSLSLTAGMWNSLHAGKTGSDSLTATNPKAWYELDGYGKLSATWWEDLTTYVLYTAYLSPNNVFNTVQEVAFGVGYNDAKLLGPFALNPSLLVAFEFDGQADAGRDEGIYAQIGIAPGYTFLADSTYPLTLTVPLAVGLSLSDYYEFGTGSDDTFGYFSAGATLSVPLAFIPPAYGKWLVKAGVQVLYLGDNLKAVNDGDELQVIGTVGLAFTY